MGLEAFSASFSLNHEDLLCELAELIEQDLDRQEKPDTFAMLDKIERWLTDFCNGISDIMIRKEIAIRFDLDMDKEIENDVIYKENGHD